MVYLGKWSDGGVVSSVDVLVVHESAVSNARLRFCFFALIEHEEPSRAFFALIFWSAFETKSSIILSYCCLDSWTELQPSIIVLATVSSRALLDNSWYATPKHQSKDSGMLACSSI